MNHRRHFLWMKTLGMVGGIGPESTIDYYRAVIEGYRHQTADGSYPMILINSIDFQAMFKLVAAGERAALASLISKAVEHLAKAGASFGLICSNTPHLVFDEIERQSAIPLLSIVAVTVAAAKRAGYKKLGLFGVRFTMQGGFYAAACEREGITVVTPNAEEQTYIHDKYLSELVPGLFHPETRGQLLKIARNLRSRHGIDAIVLGGTELPLILRDADSDIPFLDTARLHVEAAVAELSADAS